MKTKFTIILVTTLIAQVVFGKITEKDRLAIRELSREDLIVLLKKTNKDLENQKDEIVPTKVQMTALNLRIYCIHPFVEADTGYRRKWFQNIQSVIKQMSELKLKQKVARKTKNKKDFLQCASSYEKLLNTYSKLIKKPQKVDRKELIRLRKEARKKRKALEEKFKKEGVPLGNLQSTKNDEGGRRGSRVEK